MNKLWLKAVLGVVVLAGVAIGLLILNINPILESFRPEIQRKLSSSIGRPVTVGKLSLNLFPSVAVRVEDVRLESDAGGGRVKTLTLKSQLMPLLRRELAVDEAGIEGLDVLIVRKSDGTITINGIPSDAKTNDAAPPADTAGSEKKAAVNIAVKNAWLKNSRITWLDEIAQPKVEVAIENISGEFNEFSDRGLRDFRIAARLLGTGESNLIVTGSGGVTGKTNAAWNNVDLTRVAALARAYGIKLEPLELTDTLTLAASFAMPPKPAEDAVLTVELDGSNARVAYPPHFQKEKGTALVFKMNVAANLGDILGGALKSDDISLTLGGIELGASLNIVPASRQLDLKITSSKSPLSAVNDLVPTVRPYQLKGDLAANVTVQMAEGKLHNVAGGVDLKALNFIAPREGKEGLPITDINGRVELTKGAVVLHPTKLAAFGGSAAVQGNYSDDKKVVVQLQGANFDLTKVSAFVGRPAMTGTLTSLAVRLAGPAAAFADQMAGSISAEAAKGTIEGFNILGKTLGKISEIPALGGALLALIPEKHRPLVEMNATSFDKLTIGATLSGKNVALTNVNLDHPAYKVTGQGEIKADGNMEVRTQLRLTENLTGGMTEKQPKLKLLHDASKSIVLPVVVLRKDGVFLVLPDITQLGKLALGNTAKDAASKALDKVAPGLGNALDSLFK